MLQQPKRWMVYRANPPIVPDIPLRVRSTGHYSVTPEWKDGARQKWFLQLFWCSAGKGRLRVGDDWVTISPNQLFLYYPGEIHHVQAISPVWTYSWITFDHKDITQWIDGFGITQRHWQSDHCPVPLFHKIRNALSIGTAEGERTAANLAHSLLLSASARTGSNLPSSISIQAKALLDQVFRKPDIGIEEIAHQLRIHRTTLFRQFLAAYGLTPSAYLRNLRIQYGLSLLRQSNLPVQEVAWQAGFSDPNYFARAIRESTGLSPMDFRKG